MRRYSVASARQHLAEVLDLSEQGEDVVIERRGVRFAVRALSRRKAARKARPRVEIVDPEVLEGRWTWSWSTAGGVDLSMPARPRKSRRT